MRMAPTDELRMLVGLAVPAIESSRDSIRATRAGYERALDELRQLDRRMPAPSGLCGAQAFFLAYHGECDRDLQIKAASLYAQLVPALLYVSPHCQRASRRPGRIRVGFISRHLHQHSIGKTTRGLIAELDRTRFEVFGIHVVPSHRDETTAAIRAVADHWIEVVDDLANISGMHEQLAALELDVLFYQDIGMDPATYFLAFARLAPVQCVSFGHPNTTGVPNIDYFVSNDLYETAEAREHYSERLFLLRDLPTLAYYYKPEPPRELPVRAVFGLPEDATVYVCPQTLFKFHPDFDYLIGEILERDPRGRLVLIRGALREWSAALLARFERSIPKVVGRIQLLPRLSRSRFLELLSVSDVMLDPPHFNGMNSSLEAFAVGLPVVTQPTRLQRGRHTQAMYLKMGIRDCIADDAQHYIDIAVRLGTDPGARAELRHRLLEQHHVLYENPRVVREFERFFTTAVRETDRRTG
jgi:predicted O-linked N-acetylglucosamine transferase (SPINDLY family)